MKHKEIIKAWLDGETIELKHPNSNIWNTLEPEDTCSEMPYFSDCYHYRIKPKNIKVHRKVSLYRGKYAVIHQTDKEKGNVEYTFSPEGELIDVRLI